jgi:hypothetical protein
LLVTPAGFKCGTPPSHLGASWPTAQLLEAWGGASAALLIAGSVGEVLRQAGSLWGLPEWQDLSFVSYCPWEAKCVTSSHSW